MSELRATPRNATLGAIADFLKQTYAPQRTQQMQGLMEFLSVPGAASLIDDVSYHGPRALIRGGNAATGGIGTFRLDPRVTDVADVALNVAPLATLAGKGVARAARSAPAQAIDRMVREGYERGVIPAPGMTIKPKGGNWLAGHTDYALEPLKTRISPTVFGLEPGSMDPAKRIADLQASRTQNIEAGVPVDEQHIAEAIKFLQPKADFNRWIETKLGKYIRNEMGTPEDPVRALAERGILHVDPSELNYMLEAHGKHPQPGQQFVATSDAAKMWEGASDNAINVAQAGDYLKFMNDSEYAETIEKNPWLKKVPPETKVYGTAEAEALASDLGFEHLIDELKFSMDPNSGLPAALRFDPKDIDKITVPQAVERVSKINAWRAEQAAQAEKAGMMENLKATPRLADEGLQLSFVNKPGGAWVDIPETIDEKGMKLCTSIGKAGGWCTQSDWAAQSYGSGVNRLTALVDTEGRPHAQAKITSQPLRTWDDVTAAVGPEQAGVWWKELDRTDWYNSPDPNKAFDDFIKSKNIPLPADITELKPVGNSFSSERAQEYAKRDPEYFRKVETSVLKFLNSGEWGKVSDLHHYGIVDLKEPNSLLDGLKTLYGDESSRRVSQEFIDAFNYAVDTTPDAPRFMTTRQLREFIGPVEDLGNNYAGGGVVKGAVKSIGDLVRKYLTKEAPEAAAEAAVTAAPKEQKMLQGFYRGYAGENKPAQTAFGAETYFVSPQRKVADYYARRRAAETGAEPHAEMILADPFITRNNPYGLSIPIDKHNRDFLVTRARRIDPDEVKDRTPLYAEGGAFEAGEAEVSPFDTYKFANRQAVAGNDMSMAGFGAGANVGGGRLDAALEMARMQRAQDVVPQEMQNRMARMSYSKQLDDLGLNLTALKSLDAKDVYLGMLNGSIPMGLGRLLLGIQAEKTPWNTGVTGHSIGYSGRVGPGTLSANVQRRRSGDVSGNVEYRLPFAEGGAVNYDPDEIAQIAERATRGFAAGGLVNYDRNEIDTLVSQLKEEFNV